MVGRKKDGAVHLRNLDIVRRYEEGESVETLCTEYGLSRTYIYLIACNMGAKRPAQTKTERNKKLIKMYQDGATLEMVGKEYGITRERARQILVRAGVEERHMGADTPRRVKVREDKRLARAAIEARRKKYDDLAAQIRKLYDDGLTYREIADKLSIPHRSVQWGVAKTGGPNRNKLNGPRNRYNLTKEQKVDIGIRYAEGEKLNDIAATYGISNSSYVITIARGEGYSRGAGPGIYQRFKERLNNA